MTEAEYIQENERRKREFLQKDIYDPVTGEGCCGERERLRIDDAPIKVMYIPVQMFESRLVQNLAKTHSLKDLLRRSGLPVTNANIAEIWTRFEMERFYYDPEYWFITCCTITDKTTNTDTKFKMNRGQRFVHEEVLRQLYGNKPVRIIVDKARQWGCSTYSDMICGWFSIIRYEQWNIIIAAHTENTARIIRGMYNKLLKFYPKKYWKYSDPMKLTPFEGSQKTRELKGRGNRITIGSAERPDTLVGDNISAAHLSETSRWAETHEKKPEVMITSIVSGITFKPGTLIILESTGLGVGNFFYREWLRSMEPDDSPTKSAYKPIFVAWFMIDYYQSPIEDYGRFIERMNDYDKELFEMGATLEQINFYRQKEREYSDRLLFMQDFPSTWQESFASTGNPFYNRKDIERCRKNCTNPLFRGEVVGEATYGEDALKSIKFTDDDNGKLKVWKKPDEEPISDRYVVVVDIGGTSDRADWSIICVLDRKDMISGGVPEVVAEWCGHCDHDILAWKSAQIATWYREALLVIESNTLESEQTEGDHFEYILDEIAYYYHNLYTRTSAAKIREGVMPVWGFHTNKQTKQMVCDHHKKVLRENMYIEHDMATCNEYEVFERKENGSLGAKEGSHDDKNITRAIGVWVCYSQLSTPRIIQRQPKREGRVRKIRKGGSLAVI